MAAENERTHCHAESSLPRASTYNYFKAPLTTLLESCKEGNSITSYDLVQAYALLYTRIKSLATELCDITPNISPASQYLKLHVSDLAKCIVRDIERASNKYLEGFKRDEHASMQYSSGLSEGQFQYLKESVEVSHNALCVASSLFAIPSLYSLFSGALALRRRTCNRNVYVSIAGHVELMLDTVLALLEAPSLLTPGQSKTRSLALFALTGLRISTLLARKKREALIYVVSSNLSRDATLPSNESVLIDALKVSCFLLLSFNHTHK
jgi:hypothetical protein